MRAEEQIRASFSAQEITAVTQHAGQGGHTRRHVLPYRIPAARKHLAETRDILAGTRIERPRVKAVEAGFHVFRLAPARVRRNGFKRNPSAVIGAADDEAVAVLVHNRPSAYLVPAGTSERLMDRLEDLELAELVRTRARERRVKVTLDEL